jgi:hypothetical protein
VDSRGLADGSLTLSQRKGARLRNKPPVNQHSKNPPPKQDWLVGYRAFLQNLRTTYKLKLPHLIEGAAD